MAGGSPFAWSKCQNRSLETPFQLNGSAADGLDVRKEVKARIKSIWRGYQPDTPESRAYQVVPNRPKRGCWAIIITGRFTG